MAPFHSGTSKSPPPPRVHSPPLLTPTINPTSTSRVRVSSMASQASPFLLLLLFQLLAAAVPTPSIRYSDLCGSTVPDSPPTASLPTQNLSFPSTSAFFSGADEFLAVPPSAAAQRLLSFRLVRLQTTAAPGTLRLEASLTLRAFSRSRGRSLRRVVSLPRRRQPWGSVKLELSGFWSASSGRICLIGTGTGRSAVGTPRDVSAVLRMNCTWRSSISNSFVPGILESLDIPRSSSYFSPVTMMMFVKRDYNYSLIPLAKKMNAELGPVGDPLRFGADGNVCSLLKSIADTGRMELVYATGCGDMNCSPFSMKARPGWVFLKNVQCSDGKLHLNMLFSDENYHSQFDPVKALVGEGLWDQERSRFALVACSLGNLTALASSGSAIKECGIGVSLWFPQSLTILNRSFLVGQIWSTSTKSNSNYFKMVMIRGSDYYSGVVPGLKYHFTKKVGLAQACPSRSLNKSAGNSYPDRSTFKDLTFQFSVRDYTGKFFHGLMSLFSIGESMYDHFFLEDKVLPSSILAEMSQDSWNVSYKITYLYMRSSLPLPAELFDISAEGVYNSHTGVLCLMGCRSLPSNYRKLFKSVDPADCEILINVQLPSVNRIGETQMSGSIRSTRKNKDPLYFRPLEISSQVMYHGDVVQTIWRMDIELTMVLISLTLSCIFIGLQMFYVKKNREVLPMVSVVMLLILTLGHMIPLILNFDALFFMHANKQSVILPNGGWLEANEVIVRIMTMIAFLLQFRLLQITWSARSAEEHKKEFWTSEKRLIKICLPLYLIGIVIACLFNFGSYKSKAQMVVGSHNHDSLLGNLTVFSGLVLDGFLLPQILFNVFMDSKEKSLAPSYYIGITVIRSMPHIYDVYRAHSRMGRFVPTYVYASPQDDFFSTAWDIAIPFGGFALVIIIFMQQKFGGCSILPSRFKTGGYVVVPVTVDS